MVTTRSAATMENRVEGIERLLEAVMKQLADLSGRIPAQTPPQNTQSETEDDVSIANEQHGGGHRRGFSRQNRMEVPGFDGTDVNGWLVRMDRYFRANEIPVDERLNHAVIGLHGDALKWLEWWETQTAFHTWCCLKDAAVRRFAPRSELNPLSPRLKRRQVGTVMELEARNQLRGEEESDLSFHSQQQQQQENSKIKDPNSTKKSTTNSTATTNQESIQAKPSTMNPDSIQEGEEERDLQNQSKNSTFQHLQHPKQHHLSIKKTRFINQESRAVGEREQHTSRGGAEVGASTKGEREAEKDGASSIAPSEGGSQPSLDFGSSEADTSSSSNGAFVTVRSDSSTVEDQIRGGSMACACVRAAAERVDARGRDLTSIGDGRPSSEADGGRSHGSPRPRDQDRDGFGGGGGSNHHRLALPLVARPPVILAATFPWRRESENQPEPIAGDAEASRSAGGELKKLTVVLLGGGFRAPITHSEDEKIGRGSCGDVGLLGYGLILGLTQNLETQIKNQNVGPFNLAPKSKLAGIFGQLQFSALIFCLVDGLRFYQWNPGGSYFFFLFCTIVLFSLHITLRTR